MLVFGLQNSVFFIYDGLNSLNMVEIQEIIKQIGWYSALDLGKQENPPYQVKQEQQIIAIFHC